MNMLRDIRDGGTKVQPDSFLHSKLTSPVWTLSPRRRGTAVERIPASFTTIKSSDPTRQLQSVSNRLPFDFCFCLCITKKLSEDLVFGQGLGRYAFCFSVLFLRACARVSSEARRGCLILWYWICRQLLIMLSEYWEPNPSPLEEQQALFPAQPAPSSTFQRLLSVTVSSQFYSGKWSSVLFAFSTFLALFQILMALQKYLPRGIPWRRQNREGSKINYTNVLLQNC